MRREENVEAVKKNIILYWYKFLDLPSMGDFLQSCNVMAYCSRNGAIFSK